MTRIALFSPGAMGASVGAAAVSMGHEVTWHSNNRSQASIQRSDQAGLVAVQDQKTLFNQAEIVLSVCPPHAANEVAQLAISNKFQGIFLEGNAIAPSKVRAIRDDLEQANIDCVDGGIIGGPAWDKSSNTQLYVSGTCAADIAALFSGTPLTTTVLNNQIGSASALKMTFAAYTKGTTALLSAILAVAEREGVREYLETQWGEDFSQQTAMRITGNAQKAWRFKGEMEEIATTFGEAGLPPGFHMAAAEIYDRLKTYKDGSEAPTLDNFLSQLLNDGR